MVAKVIELDCEPALGQPRYSRASDSVECLLRAEAYEAEKVADDVVLYRSVNSGEVIGFVLLNASRIVRAG